MRVASLIKVVSFLLFPVKWIVYFLSYLSPRSTNIVVFGVHTQSLTGNIKALLIDEKVQDFEKIFIAGSSTSLRTAKQANIKAYYKCSIFGIYYSLRAYTYIYPSYPSDINYWLSGGAKYIELWHGVPIKKIERDVTTGYYSLRNKYRIIFSVFAPYLFTKPDVILAGSAYEKKCFSSAFDITNDAIFIEAFYPKLVPLLSIKNTQKSEKNILYAPTWRDDHSFNFADYVDLNSFNNFLQKHNMRFYIKLHPSDKSMADSAIFSNIQVIDQNENIYDYLGYANIVVSDYSSMILESLYLSKLVVLFCPDYEAYQQNSREFYINPCQDLPVEISFTQKELEEKLLQSNINRINTEKFKSIEPYAVVENLLGKLVKKAQSTL